MLCTSYTFDTKGKLMSVSGDKHKFISIESYIGTIRTPTYVNKELTISESVLAELSNITVENWFFKKNCSNNLWDWNILRAKYIDELHITLLMSFIFTIKLIMRLVIRLHDCVFLAGKEMPKMQSCHSTCFILVEYFIRHLKVCMISCRILTQYRMHVVDITYI